jgi:ribosome maturation factor RimP
MKRVSMAAVVALVAAIMAAPASAAPTKWVRGPVTAMTGNTITVSVNGVASTYKIETTTVLAARGAGTASREPAGLKLAEFVKVGQFVEVRYTEAAGAKVATEVRPLAAEEESASKEKNATVAGNTSASGTVVSVAADSIVVNADGVDVKFAVTPKTTVVGPGMGTKTRELQAAGKPAVITAYLGPKDQVVVYYTEGAAPAATSIRLIQKVAK